MSKLRKLLIIFSLVLVLPTLGFSETWVLTTSLPNIWTITFTQTGGAPPQQQFNWSGVDGSYSANGKAVLNTNSDGYFCMKYTTNSSGKLCYFIGQLITPTTAAGRQICPGGYYSTWTAVESN